MDFQCQHLIKNVKIEDYEDVFFDEALNQKICQETGLERTVISLHVIENRVHRQLRIKPQRNLPTAIQRLMGQLNIEYIETVIYDLKSLEGRWSIEPSWLGEKVKSSGKFQFIEHPEGVIREITGEIRVFLFAIGTMIENVIVTDIEQSYAKAAEITNTYLTEGHTIASLKSMNLRKSSLVF